MPQRSGYLGAPPTHTFGSLKEIGDTPVVAERTLESRADLKACVERVCQIANRVFRRIEEGPSASRLTSGLRAGRRTFQPGPQSRLFRRLPAPQPTRTAQAPRCLAHQTRRYTSSSRPASSSRRGHPKRTFTVLAPVRATMHCDARRDSIKSSTRVGSLTSTVTAAVAPRELPQARCVPLTLFGNSPPSRPRGARRTTTPEPAFRPPQQDLTSREERPTVQEAARSAPGDGFVRAVRSA